MLPKLNKQENIGTNFEKIKKISQCNDKKYALKNKAIKCKGSYRTMEQDVVVCLRPIVHLWDLGL